MPPRKQNDRLGKRKRDPVARFASLFAGLDRAHGTYVVEGRDARKNKTTGRARTIKEQVTMDHWKGHIEGKVGLGVVPIRDDGTVAFAAVDVDRYDVDHAAMEKRIEELVLPLVVCRSKSGGAHLYVFFRHPVRAASVREALFEWAIALGHPKVEIFPKQSELAGEDDVGSWINVPYFNAANTDRYAIRNGAALTFDEFLDFAESRQTDARTLKRRVVENDAYGDGPPCLQHLSATGFPVGTRNRALFNLGVYARKKYGDDWRRHLERMNAESMKPPLDSAEVQQIIRNLSKKTYRFTCSEDPIASACNRPVCQARPHGIGGTDLDPGVVIDGLTKVLTDPPTWYVNVDGRRLRIDRTEDFISQTRFSVAVVEGLNILPQKVPREAWEEIVRGVLERVEEIDAPHDASARGQFEFLFEQFCAESVPARTRDDLLLGRLWLNPDTGRTYFRSVDLMAYLERHRTRFTARQAWDVLRERDADTRAFKIKGRCVRCWGVKDIARQTEPHEIEEIDEPEY